MQSAPSEQQAGDAAHQRAAVVPVYADDDFTPLASAQPAGVTRRTTSGLQEVAVVDGGTRTEDGRAAPKPGGRAGQTFELVADSSQAGACDDHAAASESAPLRGESSGLEYAPDSKALLARMNRWWKRFDEGVMQPRFGGPTASRNGSALDLQAAAPQPSAKSFVVPVSRPGG